MYVDPDFKSAKEFKAAVKAGKELRVYNPSGLFPPPQNGEKVIEGPHYPKPHRWYSRVIVRDGFVSKVIA